MWSNRRILMLFVMFFGIIIILILNTVMSYRQSHQSIASHVNEATTQTVSQLTQNLDSTLESYEQISRSIVLNPKIRSYIDQIYKPGGNFAEAKEGFDSISELITSARNASPHIERILMRNAQDQSGNYTFLRIPGMIFSRPSNFLMRNPDSEAASRKIVAADGEPVWFPTRERSLFSPVENTTVSAQPLVTLGRYMKNLKNPERAYLIFIELKADALRSIFRKDSLNPEAGNEFYIIDQENRIVFSLDQAQYGKSFPYLLPVEESGQLELNDSDKMLIYHTSERNGWRVVGLHSTESIYRDLNTNLWYNLSTILITLILFIVAFVVFKRFSLVHRVLEKSMGEISEKKELLELQSIELQQKNAELTHLNQMKDRLIANTSHELRTPIQAVIGFAETMQNDPGEQLPSRFHEYLDRIIQSGMRLNRMVTDILDLSRRGESDEQLQFAKVNLYDVIWTAVETVRPMAEKKSLLLRMLVNKDLYVHADAIRLQQIIENLLVNAVKFTIVGHIEVIARRTSSDQVEIQILDTGIGIQEEWKKRIFEPFEQVESGDVRQFGGAGLGLSIVKKLLHLHESDIQVESEPGVGSMFSFRLKVVAAPASAGAAAKLSDSTRKTSIAPMVQGAVAGKVLVVDDEPSNLAVLNNHLTAAAWHVTTCDSGKKALKHFYDAVEKHEPFDIILMDVMMPVMDGYEVVEKIRATSEGQKVPIVMVTAKQDVEDWVHAYNSGANDYLTKPFSKSELLTRIAAHVKLHRTGA